MSEVQVEVVGCSNPKDESDICRKCIRNQPSEDYESFKIEKVFMGSGYKCDGYVNKNTPSLLNE